MTPKLRIGFLLDSVLLPAWVFGMIQRIAGSNYAETTLLVLNGSDTQKRPSPIIIWQRRNRWLYDIFNAIDERLFLRKSNASARVDASDIVSSVPVLTVQPIGGPGGQQFSVQDVEEIRSYQLDILVNIGFGRLCGEIRSAAKYGLWSYHWGDPRKIENGLIGFWEVVEQWPETGVALQQWEPESKLNRFLFESWFSNYPFSPARSRNYILWSASLFLPRQLERLHRLGQERFFRGLITEPDTSPMGLRSNDLPSNLSALWIGLKLMARNIREIYLRIFFRERWSLLSKTGSSLEKNIQVYKTISPPQDRFWADPHVIYRSPNYYVFIEEYLYQSKRGHIAVIEMDSNGACNPSVPVLKENWHLSFPFVFEWRGSYYMIPESSANRTIDLYKCTQFPEQWQHKLTLMKDITAVDTTVFHQNGKWWLFTAMAEQEAAFPQVELFLFYSDELLTDQWRPHPMNPIISDVKKARGAGSIFMRDGKLFRPSQDCSNTYGYGFDLNEISILTETEYCETTVFSVRPDPQEKIMASHTYAHQNDLTILDALMRQPKWVRTA